MTEEQIKSIEYLKEYIEIDKENIEICEENDFYEEAKHINERVKHFETILNLIEKQQKEIEDWKIDAIACREMLSDIKKGIEIEF